jgi:hypothetical protein
VLDRIQYLAENGLTSLMALHDFLSKRLAPLQDWSHRPAWTYTRVNDIMRLYRRPGSSLGDTLLAASLMMLTMDQPLAKLVMPAAGCEPLCMNQAVRTTLLVIMLTLDDVDITPVHRGDQSHGVFILGPGGPGGTAGDHSHGGVLVGGGPVGSRSGAPTAATTKVEDVDGGPPRGYWRQVQQRPPSKVKMSMAAPWGVLVAGLAATTTKVEDIDGTPWGCWRHVRQQPP